MNFSERDSIIIKEIQKKEVNNETRVHLWNAIAKYALVRDILFFEIYKSVFVNILKQTVDLFPIDDISELMLPSSYFLSDSLKDLFPHKAISEEEKKEIEKTYKKNLHFYDKELRKIHYIIRKYFFECKWNIVYDFLELIVSKLGGEREKAFINECNKVLNKEKAGYIFLNKQISPIFEKIEENELTNAHKNPNKAVREHLIKAHQILCDRNLSNYRESAEESIKAVESLGKFITPEKTPTLGKALNAMKKSKIVFNVNERFIVAVEKLWAWANAFRHGQENEITVVEFAEARLVLIICSGIINYLQIKSDDTKV